MNILIVTNMYPSKQSPTWGIFVKEQVESIKYYYPEEFNIKVHIISGPKKSYFFLLSLFRYLKSMFLLPRILNKNKIDLIHAHFGLSLISLFFIKKPIIITLHGSDVLTFPSSIITKMLLHKAKHIIAVSQNILEKTGSGVVLHCGIETGKFLLENYSKETCFYPKKKNSLTILFPSNPMYKVKNYSLFSKVCDILKSRGIEINVLCLKGIKRDKVPEIYWQSDIMLLTSFSEGSPTVIKEAISAKLPYVSVDVGDVRKWTSLIDFGYVVNSRDPEKIAEKVIDISDKIDNRIHLDNDKALKMIDISYPAKMLKSIYNKMLK